MFRTALKKGSTEMLALSTLVHEERHGYEIGKLIELRSGGAIRFRISSLYPVLLRMEKRGWIAGRWVERKGERRRRFYRLTAAGRAMLQEQASHWRIFAAAVEDVLEAGHA